MPDTPWLGDACSLVDAFRAGELSPVEALDASLAAIEGSGLNAFSHLDADGARAAARQADVTLPFGGVPIGVKELHRVKGWPYTHGSLVFKGRTSDIDGTEVERLRAAGAVLVGLTTSSEFGYVAYTSTKLNGTTRNPWNTERTPGGSSGGSAAAVAGGLVPLCEAMDGGGSIRIPAGYSGLFGLKATYGRYPLGPRTPLAALVDVYGCVSRSVRDTARYLDACSGYDPRDQFSLLRVDGWEAGLGAHPLEGRRVAVDPTLGGVVVHPEIQAIVTAAAEMLIKAARLRQLDVPVSIPTGGLLWGAAGLGAALYTFRDVWPERADDLTDELRFGLTVGEQYYDAKMAAQVERFRVRINEAMADVFDQVDFVICATNPVEAYAAEGPSPVQVGDMAVDPFNIGLLTMPANMTGYPAMSIPVGTTASGLPVGLQVYGRRHEEALLLDLAQVAERERPWPLVAPGAPI